MKVGEVSSSLKKQITVEHKYGIKLRLTQRSSPTKSRINVAPALKRGVAEAAVVAAVVMAEATVFLEDFIYRTMVHGHHFTYIYANSISHG